MAPMPILKPNMSKFYKFNEFILKTEEEIRNNIYSGIYIDDTILFKNNFDMFLKILSIGDYSIVYSKDYECLKFIEDNLPSGFNIKLGLVDDFENKDRSYIDVDYFSKTSFIIPFVYSMWNVRLVENTNIACYYANENLYPMVVNDFSKVSLEFLKRVREIIEQLNNQLVSHSDIEKIVLISNYIQNNTQYVDAGNISNTQNGVYITDSKGIEIGREVHSPETILFKHYGVCEGIANATTILLNNPIFDVDVRSVFGSSHVWNIVSIDGKYYYVDNTWNITRNKNLYEESLKAKSFSYDYLLFGSDCATILGHHIPYVYVKEVEGKDLPKEKILESQKILKKVNFSDYDLPTFKSKLQ